MLKTITYSKLQKMGACEDGLDWWNEEFGEGRINISNVVKQTLERYDEDDEEIEYMLWLVLHLMTEEQQIAFVTKCDIYEEYNQEYDEEPTEAIYRVVDYELVYERCNDKIDVIEEVTGIIGLNLNEEVKGEHT